MKKNFVPKAKTVLAFLKSKGWVLDKKTHLFYVMNPPDDLHFSENFQYFIPANEAAVDYERYVKNLVDSISQLYEIDFQHLCELLSVNVEDLRAEEEFRSFLRRELAAAA